MSRRRRKSRAQLTLGGLCLALLALAAGYFGLDLTGTQQTLPPQEGEMSLIVLDVGQGDSLLLHSEGQWALVDAGTADSAETILQALDSYGAQSLTLAVATHPHADHIGSMAEVLDAYPPEVFWMPDAENTSATYENMLDAVERSGAEAILASTGDCFTLGSMEITVLSPAPGADIGDELNNASLVLLCEGAGVRFLLTGDAEAPMEEIMLQNGLPQVDVLKVGHHGSSTSSSAAFIQALQPRYAAISCGVGNSYGHPATQTLETLDSVGAQVLRTDTQGTLVFNATGGQIDVHTER